MWFWYNTQLLSKRELILNPDNRAFQYGDGIFETIIVNNRKIQHSEYHEHRVKLSTKVLKLNFTLSFDEVQERINFLLTKNKMENARAKLIIWRKAGGFYIPKENEAEYLILLNPLRKISREPQHLEVSNDVRIPRGLTKNCKTLNALPYILAGLELKERNDADDLILLDTDGKVSECISSNLFWYKDGTYFTPSLETNCVAGVKRNYLLDKFKEANFPVKQVLASIEELQTAQSVFKTNVTGIYPVKSIGKATYTKELSLPFSQETE